MYICGECEKEFETFQEKANHVRWQHLKYTFRNNETKEKTKLKFIKREEKTHGIYIEENIICSKENCNNIVHIKYRQGKKKDKYFCSLNCSQSHIHSEISKNKCSNSVKLAWKRGDFNTDSFREKQSKNAINIRFSSKKEREIVNYFKTNYLNDEWKAGGGLYYNGEEISRDLYSNKLKICFEYDGIWHFKDIHNQLERKQRKDKLLEIWCIENRYRLIRIDEKEFIDFDQIEKLFFEDTRPIIKIGKRY